MSHRVRRRAGAARTGARLITAGLVVATATGCGGIGQPAPYDSQGIDGLVIPTATPDPDDFTAAIDNEWLPLTAGSSWRYDVTDDGTTIGTIETEVLDTTTEIAGLTATAVETTTQIDGEQTSTRFYAQDDEGNVWWVGADEDDLSWRAGEDGAEAGLAMPAGPRLGDGWPSYVVAGQPQPSVQVADQGRDMVQMRESVGAADTATLSYTSGVGPTGIEDLAAGWLATLVDHQPG